MVEDHYTVHTQWTIELLFTLSLNLPHSWRQYTHSLHMQGQCECVTEITILIGHACTQWHTCDGDLYFLVVKFCAIINILRKKRNG